MTERPYPEKGTLPHRELMCVRRYIDRPLLVNGRKFHLRAYVLCVGSLTAYVFDEILVLCAPDKYDAGLQQLGNQRSHLTNTCLQASADGDAAGPRDAEDQGLIKLLSELPQVCCNAEALGFVPALWSKSGVIS